MHRRPEGKDHAGLWEFPGGKVEVSEIPVKALIRELREELDIEVQSEHCLPAVFAQDPPESSDRPIVILLYILEQWTGSPRALEGGKIDWFSPSQIESLDKPPLDRDLASLLFRLV